MDDLSINTTLADIHKELQNPTLTFDAKNPFHSLPIKKQAALLTIAKTQRVLAVLDFSGFAAKQVKSNDLTIQNTLNQDNRLIPKTSDNFNIHPNQHHLTNDIL